MPTSDTERRTSFGANRRRTTSALDFAGHHIAVDVTNGNLIVSTADMGSPFYALPFGVTRTYDAQEQNMQLSYIRDYPNVDPKPHWFGSWQFGFEVQVDEVWHNTRQELHVNSDVDAAGLFEEALPDFRRNQDSRDVVAALLRSFGVSGAVQTATNWTFRDNDLLLRTKRGPFRIITGSYRPSTLVDETEAKLWVFNPIRGTAWKISSEYATSSEQLGVRDLGPPLTATVLADTLGHNVRLNPDPQNGSNIFLLVDSSGRRFRLVCGGELSYLDGVSRGHVTRRKLVSEVVDERGLGVGVHEKRSIQYTYDDHALLQRVESASATGIRRTTYHYDDPTYPGLLTGIEDSFGEIVKFEYTEDWDDCDDRLRPRVKLRRITDPEGIVLEYEYDIVRSQAVATVRDQGGVDRRDAFEYVRDTDDTRRRYVTRSETDVARGYMMAGGAVVDRTAANAQAVVSRTEYSTDGRHNPEREIDPLNRMIRRQYNDFNQMSQAWDRDGHWTKYHYDLPLQPSASEPNRYDLIGLERESLLKRLNPEADPPAFVTQATVVSVSYAYQLLDAASSSDAQDFGRQSSHRISEFTDERRKTWKARYDDPTTFSSLLPSEIESPLSYVDHFTYDDVGQMTQHVDAEGNATAYVHRPDGNLESVTHPNGEVLTIDYYQESSWPSVITDEAGGVMQFSRAIDGRLVRVLDGMGHPVDYTYQRNGRVETVVEHRPALLADSDDHDTAAITSDFVDMLTEFTYAPLGAVKSIRSPSGLSLVFDRDEVGRVSRRYHDVPAHTATLFVYDAGGQLTQLRDRNDQVISYAYHANGLLRLVTYPNWNDGVADRAGATVEYGDYDYAGRALVITSSDLGGPRDLSYDERGALVLRHDPDDFEVSYSYDDDGRLTHVADSAGLVDWTLDLDELGRPRSLADADLSGGAATWQFTYRKASDGQELRLNLYQRSVEGTGLRSTYDYDQRQRLTAVSHEADDGHSPAHQFFAQEVTYQADGVITSLIGDDAATFRHDAIHQLIHDSTDDSYCDYDLAGNRTYRQPQGPPPQNQRDGIDGENRLRVSQFASATLTYDQNGNLSSRSDAAGVTRYFFDGANQLRVIRSQERQTGLTYDEAGRVYRIEDTASATQTASVVRVHYALSRPTLLRIEGGGGLLFTWDPTGSLLRIRHLSAAGDVVRSVFALENGLGNTVRLVDDGMHVRGRAAFDAWGVATFDDPHDSLAFLGFHNGMRASPRKEVLFGSRWYAPDLGRWLSEDPSVGRETEPEQFSTANNLYRYVLNSPITLTDATGWEPESPEIEHELIQYGLVHALKHTGEEASVILGETAGAGFPGALARAAAVGVTIGEGTAVLAELGVIVTKHLRELADVEAHISGYTPVEGTNTYISPTKGRLFEIDSHLSSSTYGTLIPVEGALKTIWAGSVYYNPASRTTYWRDEQGAAWRSYKEPASP